MPDSAHLTMTLPIKSAKSAGERKLAEVQAEVNICTERTA
jgi:hypothetical protein